MILKVSLVFDPSIQIVYTDAWMYDPKIQDYLEAAVPLLLKMLRDQFDGNADDQCVIITGLQRTSTYRWW